MNAGFLSLHERRRPWLTLKLGASLDGRIAAANGESRWITGPAARERVHLMRAEHDAVMVGVGSARADDPMLDVRLPGLETRKPARIVADGALSLSFTSRLARTAEAHPLWLLHRPGVDRARATALQEFGATCIEVPATPDGEIDASAALTALGRRGLTRVLCEGGGRLAASLLRDGLADEVAWFSAGLALGGEGQAAVARMGASTLASAPRLSLVSVEALGGDTLSLWRRET